MRFLSSRSRARRAICGLTPSPLRVTRIAIEPSSVTSGCADVRRARARVASDVSSSVIRIVTSLHVSGKPCCMVSHCPANFTRQTVHCLPVSKTEKKRALTEDRLREFLREMLLIRRFEEKVEERFRAGELPGFLHVAIGQEAVAVGACAAMADGDVFGSTHRAHGHTLARGTHPNAVMAELYGKMEGCSHGYGGSMHLYDVERGNLGANAVVGGGIPAMVGAGLAFSMRDEPRVAIAFFGDGATNTGTFHESLNLAQLWKTRTVFICENNTWAESTPGWQHSPVWDDMSKRAVAFDMHSIKVNGQDVEEVFEKTSEALEYARSGAGPVFLDVETFRMHGHYIGDPQVYRGKEDRDEAAERDPIVRLREILQVTSEEWAALEAEVKEIVDVSVEFAKNGTDPQPEDALKNIYA
ncbi:MAG: hypothetical protein F2663_03320 [Actinobacteria bacterium]|nr:hypothetical protein [Actinomycetota bacterium]